MTATPVSLCQPTILPGPMQPSSLPFSAASTSCLTPGPSSANTVPTTCSKTTITGTYSAVAPPFPTSTAQCVAAVTVPVTFWLIENTYYGENVYMTGNVSALGDWNASAGYSLNAGLYTSDENLWFATVKGLEPGVTMEYKFYKIEPGNSVTFEGGENRVYAVPTACPVAPQVHAVWQT